MKRYVLAAALALAMGGVAHAAAIDLATEVEVAGSSPLPAAIPALHPGIALFSFSMSELPEPEVFAMMLVGLILIGYRARRDSNEKFK